MNVLKTELADVLILEPRVFADERGYFFESFNARTFAQATGLELEFVQDNESHSVRSVLRGLHYQIQHAQGKLVRATSGEIFDVAVDLRKHSATFGKWVAVRLSGENKRQLWVPAGFAHGFAVLSQQADVQYKTTDFYHREHERCIRWNDPQLAINWPLAGPPIVSKADAAGVPFKDAECFS